MSSSSRSRHPDDCWAVVRVATWNVLHRDRQRRLAEVVRTLAEVDPDVVLLQETSVDHAVDVAAALGFDLAAIPEHDPAQHVPALLTSLAVEHSVIDDLPSPSSTGHRHYAVTSTLSTTSGPVRVCTTHLSATRAAGRMALRASGTEDIASTMSERLNQIAFLREALRIGPSEAFVLGGDLNFVPDGPEYRQMLALGLADSWRAGPRIGCSATVLEHNPLVGERPGAYAELAQSVRPGISGPLDYTLDYQFHSPSLEVIGAWTFGRPVTKQRWASDHLGIAVDYRSAR